MPFRPVFDEEVGPDRLADIVVIRADTGQQRVGADGFGGPLGHVADDQGVVIGAGRLQQELAQQRVRGPRDLEQLQRRRHAEQRADQVEPNNGDRDRQQDALPTAAALSSSRPRQSHWPPASRNASTISTG